MGRTMSLVLYAVLLWHTIAGVVYLTTPCEIPLPTPVYTAAVPATMTRTPTQTITQTIISTPTKLVGLPATTAMPTAPLPIDVPEIKPRPIEDASESVLLEEIPGNMPIASFAEDTVADDDHARFIVHTSLPDKPQDDFGQTHVTKNITSYALKEIMVFGSLLLTWDMRSSYDALVYTAQHFSSPIPADVYGDGQSAHIPNRNGSRFIIFTLALLSASFLVAYLSHRHVFLRHEERQEDCGSVEAPDEAAATPSLPSIKDDKATPFSELLILEPEQSSLPESPTQAKITLSSEATTSITSTPSSSTTTLPETETTMDNDSQCTPGLVDEEVQPFDSTVEQDTAPSVESLSTKVDNGKTSSAQTLEPEQSSTPETSTHAEISTPVSCEVVVDAPSTALDSVEPLFEPKATIDSLNLDAQIASNLVDDKAKFYLKVEQECIPSVGSLPAEVDNGDSIPSTQPQTPEPEQPSTREVPMQADITPGKFMSPPSTPLDSVVSEPQVTADSSDLDVPVALEDNEAQHCNLEVKEDTMPSVEPLSTDAEVKTPTFINSTLSTGSLASTSTSHPSALSSGPFLASSSSPPPSSPRTRIRTCRNWSACGGAHYCRFAHIPVRLTGGRTLFFEDEQGNFWDKPMHGECVHSRSLYPTRSPPRQRIIDPSNPSPRRQRTMRTDSNSDAIPAPGAGRADGPSWNDTSAPAVGSWGGAGWQKNKNKRGGRRTHQIS